MNAADQSRKTPKWSDIANDPAFQNADKATRQEVRGKFFDRVVRPDTPAGMLEEVQSKFFTQTEEDVFGKKPESVTDGDAAADEGPNLASNALRNAGERGLDLVGNAMQFVGNVAEKGEKVGGYGLDFASHKEPTNPEDTDFGLIDAGQAVEDVSLGYQPRYTIDQALDNPSMENLAGAAVEQGPAALADMAALYINPPAYLASRAQEIGEGRVQNDGREGMPEFSDYAVSAPTAAASVALDRFALGKLLPGGKGAVSKARQVPGAVVRASATEAGTEAVQEGGIEYAGESVGTEEGWSPDTAGRRAAGGAIVGGPTGGAVRLGTATAEAVGNRSSKDQANRDDAQEPDSSTSGESPQESADGEVASAQAPDSDAVRAAADLIRQPRSELSSAEREARDSITDGEAFKALRATAEEQGDTEAVAELDAINEEVSSELEAETLSRSRGEGGPTDSMRQNLDQTAQRFSSVMERLNGQGLSSSGEAAAPSMGLNMPEDQATADPEFQEGSENGPSYYRYGDQETTEQAWRDAWAQEGAETDVTVAGEQPSQQPMGLQLPDSEEKVRRAASRTNTEPTPAQAEAGNYRKGKVRLDGLDVAIENPKGSTRSGTDPDGDEWESTMAHHYGDIKGTVGADGDNLDVFVGDKPENGKAFVIDQVNEDGSFDEHKVMLGFDSVEEAREGYLANYEEGWQGLGEISEVSTDDLKSWMRDGDTQAPFSMPQQEAAEGQANAAGSTTRIEGDGKTSNRQAPTSRVPVDQIEVDPAEYQFRTDVNDEGIDSRLDGVKRWDDVRAGSLMLHEREDGRLFAADGHHRLDLAQRTGQQEVNAQILREQDGYSVSDARREAAESNIADGNATASDAAKVFRNSEGNAGDIITERNLPRRSQVVRDGADLAKLSDEAFGAVLNNVVKEKDGAAIGRHFDDPDQQLAAIDAFKKVDPQNDSQRQLLANEVRQAGFKDSQGEQGGLFGDDPMESLIGERVKVMDKLRSDLVRDRHLFATLNKNADKAQQAGNRIATDQNEAFQDASAQALDVLERATTTPGVNQQINDAARRVNDGESVAKAASELKEILLNGNPATDERQRSSAPDSEPDATAGLFERPDQQAPGTDDARAEGSGQPRLDGGEGAASGQGLLGETDLSAPVREGEQREETAETGRSAAEAVNLKADGRPFPTRRAVQLSKRFRDTPGAEPIEVEGGWGFSVGSLSDTTSASTPEPRRRQPGGTTRLQQQASEALGGAQQGDTIRLNANVGYATPGTYRVNQIQRDGRVNVTNTDRGSSTILDRGEWLGASRQIGGAVAEPLASDKSLESRDQNTQRVDQPDESGAQAEVEPKPPESRPRIKWKRRNGRRVWDGSDGTVIADHSIGDTKNFMAFADNAAYDRGENFATGDTLKEAKALSETAARPDSGDTSLLETQTEESLAARDQEIRQAEQADADRRREEEQRAQADAEVDDFSLTGSDRPADIAMANGQLDITDQGQEAVPASEEVAEGTPDVSTEAPDTTQEAPEVSDGASDSSASSERADQDALFSRSSTVRGDGGEPGISVAEAERIADDFMDDYNGNVPLDIVVVERQEEAYGPEATRESVGTIKGAYHSRSRKLVLVASSLRDARDARTTLAHEVLGHYGLNTFTPDQKREILDSILEVEGDVSSSLADAWVDVQNAYQGQSRSIQAEEVFARVAEKDQGQLGEAWNRVLAGLNRALRSAGLIGRSATKPELHAMAGRISREIRSGRRRQQTFPQSDAAQFSRQNSAENGEARYSFAGKRAQSADTRSLGYAQERIAQGSDSEEVRQETGWFRGSDGEWRFEIDDSDARWNPGISRAGLTPADVIRDGNMDGSPRPYTVGELIEHDALFAAYPGIRDIKVSSSGAASTANGQYDANDNTIRLATSDSEGMLSTLLHEIQHGIQNIEGFARGGSPEMFRAEHARLQERVREINEQMLEASRSGESDRYAELIGERGEIVPRIQELEGAYGIVGENQYHRLAGEVEARNVQARQRLTETERRGTAPAETQDVPDSDVIVTYNGEEMANAPAPANVEAQPERLHQSPHAEDIRARLADHPELSMVEVVQSASALPEKALMGMLLQGVRPSDVRGIYNPETGSPMIVADNLVDEADAVRAGVHEAVGHYGIRGVLGEDLEPVLEQVFRSYTQSKAGRHNIAEIKEAYPHIANKAHTREGRLELAEELIAHTIESDARPKLHERVMSAIRQQLRKLFPSIEWRTSDILALGEQSRRWLRRQEGQRAADQDAATTSRYSISQQQAELSPEDVATQLREEFPGLKLDLMQRGRRVTVSRIVAPEQRQGTGSAVMQRLTDWADASGRTLALTPTSDFGGNKKRLREFYHRFGFVENKGRHKDYEISETMYREPDHGVGELRFSIAKPSGTAGGKYSSTDSTGFAMPDEGLGNASLRKMADKMRPLKILEDAIRKTGQDIEEEADAYLAEELFHGKVEYDLRQLREQYVESLADGLAKTKITQAELDDYLYARHAPERNATIAERNPDDPGMQDGGSGMTNAEAAEIIDRVASSGKQAEYDRLASLVDGMTQLRLDAIRDGGLEDDSVVDDWESHWQYYVPLKGWAEDADVPPGESGAGRPRTGRGFEINGRESRIAGGRKTRAASPSSQVIVDANESLIRRRKNEVAQSLLSMVTDHPNPDLWEVFTNDSPDIQRTPVHVTDPETGQKRIEVRDRPVNMAGDHRYFKAKRAGRTYYIKIHDERLMNAMRNLGPESLGRFVQTASTITRAMSSLVTSYNPEFMLTNFSRDVQTALLNLSAEQTRDDGKIKGEQIVRQTARDIKPAMFAAWRGLNGKEGKDAKQREWNQWFEEFQEDGAKTGYFDMKDIEGQAKEIQSMVRRADGTTLSHMLKARKKTTDFVENMNGAVENAVRLSAYANARRAGVSRKKAASLAKNMTVNFNRRGEAGTALNAAYMFANASIQGTMNFARTMVTVKDTPKGKSPMNVWLRMNLAQKLGLGMATGSFVLGMLNRWLSEEDEDGVLFYDKIPDYEKERNLVLMTGWMGGDDEDYVKIPLPYGYNVFSVVGTHAEAVAAGSEEVTEAAKNLVLAVAGSFSPIGFEDSDEAHSLFLKNLTPTIFRSITQIGVNENFSGRPIYREDFPFGTPTPDSSRSFRSTPEAYKGFASFLNEFSGGTDNISGEIDVSPDVMQHLVNYYGGGAWGFVEKTADYAKRMATSEEVNRYRVPFAGRFMGSVNEYGDMQRFYERRDELGQIANEAESLRGMERVNYRRGNQKKLRLFNRATHIEKRLRELRKQRDRVGATEALSDEAKKRRIDMLEKQMQRWVDDFNNRYNEVTEG